MYGALLMAGGGLFFNSARITSIAFSSCGSRPARTAAKSCSTLAADDPEIAGVGKDGKVQGASAPTTAVLQRFVWCVLKDAFFLRVQDPSG